MSLKIKVTHVETVSFIRSEMTNINTQIEKAKLKLAPNEAAILFSMMGNQVVLVKRPEVVQMGKRQRRMYISTRVRLDGGTWYQNLKELFIALEEFGLDITGMRTHVLAYAEAVGKYTARRLKAVG